MIRHIQEDLKKLKPIICFLQEEKFQSCLEKSNEISLVSDTPKLFPKLNGRDAHSKARDKSPRLLGRPKNGIGNVCINKKLKMTAKQPRKKTELYKYIL